ncbi:hypothetical protein N7491_011240 [Penicillium cf. griseofulvum]|nr:hypothetical protein N7491_011240 [Penicillium cf. griseofulvum]
MPLARTRSYFATEDTTAEQYYCQAHNTDISHGRYHLHPSYRPSTDPATSRLLPRGIPSIAVPEALPPAVTAQTTFVRYPTIGVRTAPRWESP